MTPESVALQECKTNGTHICTLDYSQFYHQSNTSMSHTSKTRALQLSLTALWKAALAATAAVSVVS